MRGVGVVIIMEHFFSLLQDMTENGNLPPKKQFLHVYITFSQMPSGDDAAGYAHYLWRITLEK